MLERSVPFSERSQPPRSVSLDPRDRHRRYPENERYDIMCRKIGRVEDRVEDQHRSKHGRIEQVAWQKEPENADKVSQHTHLYMFNEMIFPRQVLLQQSQRPKFL